MTRDGGRYFSPMINHWHINSLFTLKTQLWIQELCVINKSYLQGILKYVEYDLGHSIVLLLRRMLLLSQPIFFKGNAVNIMVLFEFTV